MAQQIPNLKAVTRYGKSGKRRKRCLQNSLEFSEIGQKIHNKFKEIFSIVTELWKLQFIYLALWQYGIQNLKKFKFQMSSKEYASFAY